MTTEELIRKIKTLDRKTDEFAELFYTVNEMYFTFDDPDEYQLAATALNLVLHRGEEWMVEILAKIANQLFECVNKDIKATHGNFNIEGKDFFFDLYQNKDALAAVHKMFRNVILRKAESSAEREVKK